MMIGCWMLDAEDWGLGVLDAGDWEPGQLDAHPAAGSTGRENIGK